MKHKPVFLYSIRLFVTLFTMVGMLGFPALSSAAGAGGFFDMEEGVNIIGLGIGGVPDYQGSEDYEAGIGPFGRYHYSGNRYINVLGPELSWNVSNDDVWQFGPRLMYRFGRDDDVEDKVVKRMREIDDTVEAGAFVVASYELDPNDPRERLAFSADLLADVGNEHDGWISTFGVKYWAPVARTVVMHVGGGFSYASDDYVDTYFGVHGTDVLLFPSLGGRSYDADGGINDVRAVIGALVHLSPDWHLGAGVRYQRLLGDAKDSPVVDERGDANQWVFGVGLGYAWQ